MESKRKRSFNDLTETTTSTNQNQSKKKCVDTTHLGGDRLKNLLKVKNESDSYFQSKVPNSGVEQGNINQSKIENMDQPEFRRELGLVR